MDPIFVATAEEIASLDSYLCEKTGFKLYALIKQLSLPQETAAAESAAIAKIVKALKTVMHTYKIDVNDSVELQEANQRFNTMSISDQADTREHFTEIRATIVPPALEKTHAQISFNLINIRKESIAALGLNLTPDLCKYLLTKLTNNPAMTEILAIILTNPPPVQGKKSETPSREKPSWLDSKTTLTTELTAWRSHQPPPTDTALFTEWSNLNKLINFFANCTADTDKCELQQNLTMLIHCSREYCTSFNHKTASCTIDGIQNCLMRFFTLEDSKLASAVSLLVQILPEKHQSLLTQLTIAVHDYFSNNDATQLMNTVKDIATTVTNSSILDPLIRSFFDELPSPTPLRQP